MYAAAGVSAVPAPQLSLGRTPAANSYRVPLRAAAPPRVPLEEPFVPGGIALPGAGEPIIVDPWRGADRPASASGSRVAGSRPAHPNATHDGTNRSLMNSSGSVAPGGVANASTSILARRGPPATRRASDVMRYPPPLPAAPQSRSPPDWNSDVKTVGVFDPSLAKVTVFPRRGRDRGGGAGSGMAVGSVQPRDKQSPGPSPLSAYELPVAPPLPVYPPVPRRGASLLPRQKPRRRRSPVLSPKQPDRRFAHVQSQYSQRPATAAPPAAGAQPQMRRGGAGRPASAAAARRPRALQAQSRARSPPAPSSTSGTAAAAAAAAASAAVAPHPAPAIAPPPPSAPPLASAPEPLEATSAGPLSAHTTYAGGARHALPCDPAPPGASCQWSPPASGSTRSDGPPLSEHDASQPAAALLQHPAHADQQCVGSPRSPASPWTRTGSSVPPPPSRLPQTGTAPPPLLRIEDAARLLGVAAASTADLEALLRRLGAVQAARTGAQLALEAHQAVALNALAASRSVAPPGTSFTVTRALRVVAHELVASERVARKLGHQNWSGPASASGGRVAAGPSELDALPLGVVMAVAEQEVATESTPGRQESGTAAKPEGRATTTQIEQSDKARSIARGSPAPVPSTTTPQQQPQLRASLGNDATPSARRVIRRTFPASLPAPTPLFSRRRPGFTVAVTHDATAYAEAVHRRRRINEVSLTAAGVDPLRLVADAAASIADAIVAEVAAELTTAVDGVAEALLEAV